MECGNGNSNEWDWNGEDYYLQNTLNDSVPQCMWNEVAQNEEDLSNMFDETTPAKDCGDLSYNMSHDNWQKESERLREKSSQLKRRRMLQFDNQMTDCHLSCEEVSSPFLKSSERVDTMEEIMPDESQQVYGFSENVSASNDKDLDGSSEEWLADCLNYNEMNFSPEDMIYSGAPDPDVQIDISELCNTPHEFEAYPNHQRSIQTPLRGFFKGRKSYIRAPTKLTSSVAYPFAFIKPSGAQGDITLKDINQRIRTPPPSKLKKVNEDPVAAYPTSALTGKPVVGKTKIRTEGGKGSITIMRTKG